MKMIYLFVKFEFKSEYLVNHQRHLCAKSTRCCRCLSINSNWCLNNWYWLKSSCWCSINSYICCSWCVLGHFLCVTHTNCTEILQLLLWCLWPFCPWRRWSLLMVIKDWLNKSSIESKFVYTATATSTATATKNETTSNSSYPPHLFHY